MSSTSESLVLLSQVSLFDSLPRRSLRRLARRCVVRHYPAGAVLIEQDGAGLGLFVLVDGEVEVARSGAAGVQVVARLGRGEVVGELALIDDRPRSASVTATRDTRCLLITRNGFRELVRRDPEVAWLFVPVLAERLREMQERVSPAAGDMPPDEKGFPAAAEAIETPRASDDDRIEDRSSEERKSRADGAVRDILRFPSAFARAGLAALVPATEVGRELLDTFDAESGLDRGDDPASLVRRLPRAVVKATVAAVARAETVPETILSSLRHHLRRPPS